jgi:salicylate hydroxylase
MYPVSGGKFVNVVAILRDNLENTKVWEGPWKVDVTQEEFLEVYKGFEEELLALLRVCVYS